MNPYSLTPPAHTADPLSAVDLFCGAGGFSLGLIAAGYDLRYANDVSESCENTHRHNFPEVPFDRADIKDLKRKDVLKRVDLPPKELDLLVGGPPCQGFSIIGGRKRSDPRNGLFRQFMRVAKILQPRAIIMENVPGLATLAKGAVLQEIGEAFDDAGYRVSCAELVAAHYGVPQMRWRLVFLGYRKDTGLRFEGFPAPTHGTTGIGSLLPNRSLEGWETEGFLTAGEAIRDLPAVAPGQEVCEYDSVPRCAFQEAMREGLDGELFNHYAPRLNQANIDRISFLEPGQDWRDLPREMLPKGMQRALRKDHTRRYRRMRWDGVPRSIITRFRDPKSGEYGHPDQPRTISIREAARIQSFPDRFEFLGTNSTIYDQVGNAVPPLLAKAIGVSVGRALRGQHEPAEHPPKSRYRVPLEPSLFSHAL